MYYTKPTAIVTTIMQSESVSATPWESLDIKKQIYHFYRCTAAPVPWYNETTE